MEYFVLQVHLHQRDPLRFTNANSAAAAGRDVPHSRSQQERRFHPAVWVPRAAMPRSPHPTSSATEPLSHSEELPSSKARHIQASLQHILECFSGALALEFWLPNSFCHEAVCSSPSGRADAGAGGEDRGTRASHPVPCLLESC